jgi:DNA-binding NarL/FixJ family response regulator
VPALLERDAQRAELGELLRDLVLGHGALVLVEGPAGIGKTEVLRLAHSMAASHEVEALQGKGGELEREFPFGVARQLFEPVLVRATPAQREELFAGAAGRARPVLDRDRQTEPRTQASGSVEAVLHGLYWVAANLGERAPLLLVVDDAHWADRSSLLFLAYLARRLEDLSVALVLAVRTGERAPGAELRQLASQSRVLTLPPLSQAAVGKLAADRLGRAVSPAFASACEEVTGGNPYLVGELVRALSDAAVEPTDEAAARVRTLAPPTVARAVLARLAGLSESAEGLARAVALLGRDAGLRHAAQLADLDDAEAARAADALVAASILSPGRPLEFVHPLVRSAIYAELAPAARARNHRRAAAQLADDGAEPERVAAHLLAVDPAGDRWVVERLREAADKALAGGAPEAAVRYLARASAEPPAQQDRSPVFLALGAAQASLGAPEATATLRASVETAADPHGRATAARTLARDLHMRGEALEAALVLEEALDHYDAEQSDQLRRGLEGDLLQTTQSAMSARHHLADRLAQARAQTLEGEVATSRVVQAVVSVDLAHTDGAADAAAAIADRVLAGGFGLEDGDISIALFLATVTLTLCDRLSAAQTVLDRTVEEAQSRGSLTDSSSALCLRGIVHYRQGQLRDAEADARLALDQSYAPGAHILRAWNLANLADILMQRGQPDEAERLLSSDRLGPYDPDSILYQPFRDATARLSASRGELDTAMDQLRALEKWELRWGVRNPSQTQWRAQAALAQMALGAHDEACRLAEEDLLRARAFGAPRALGVALRVAAIVEGDAGVERLTEAVDILAASEARLEHAWALFELGSAVRRAGRRADARAPLRAALDLADRCGATNLADRTRHELHTAGARPRRERLSGIEALTPQERRVAQMAAGGMTNRAIAQALFLTTRTIEMHLANAYRKLGVSARTGLPRALGVPDES